MSQDYPLKFTLEDGVHVTVNKTAEHTYDFSLQPEKGSAHHFTFIDDQPREAVIDSLNFDELNAVRRFWLEQE